MSDERLPKRIFYGELRDGIRHTGGQKKRFKDTLKKSMKDFNIDHTSWETTAINRTAWRGAIGRGAKSYETRRIEDAKAKRSLRKARDCTNSTSHHDADLLPCPYCTKTFKARIGLFSHLRTHQI